MTNFRKACLYVFGFLILTAVLIETTPVVKADDRFQKAIAVVLLHEGGLTNDPSDKGGLTNWGISLRFIRSAHIDPNGDGVESADDIIHLTKTDADNIYLTEWYKKYHYNLIKNDMIMTKILDGSINMGASRAHRIVKQALNLIYHTTRDINGTLDPKTINLINHTEPITLHAYICEEEAEFYKDIIRRNPSFEVFRKGWLKRAAS